MQLFSVNTRQFKEKDALDNIMYIDLQCSTGWYIKEVKATNGRRVGCMISLYHDFLDIGYTDRFLTHKSIKCNKKIQNNISNKQKSDF